MLRFSLLKISECRLTVFSGVWKKALLTNFDSKSSSSSNIVNVGTLALITSSFYFGCLMVYSFLRLLEIRRHLWSIGLLYFYDLSALIQAVLPDIYFILLAIFRAIHSRTGPDSPFAGPILTYFPHILIYSFSWFHYVIFSIIYFSSDSIISVPNSYFVIKGIVWWSYISDTFASPSFFGLFLILGIWSPLSARYF